MRILLVDDVKLDRMQLEIRLKQLGHIVTSAASGAEALDVYPTFDPELVLLDISMPDMDGFEVSRKVREYFPDWIPIIFLSGHDEPEMIAKAIQAGGDDYLIKPVDKLVLSSKLTAMQRIANMRRELKQTTAKLEELNMLLHHQANEDGLTKLFNRRYIDTQLEEMITGHGRHQQTLSLILLDVDFFKPFNDNYGHIEGDHCLQQIATTLQSCFTRSSEYVGRYGGEEFVILMANAGTDVAKLQAERIKQSLDKLAYPHLFSKVAPQVTVSQGIVSIIPTGTETPNDIYKMADSALYDAKSSGRNTYVVFESNG
ncbi:diguanylate cyclase response regulator [Vibrio sp. 10N.286.49.B3]|nr:diguanylate cyclase response regulator [Vibrio sp. 10N.286.49.B3]